MENKELLFHSFIIIITTTIIIYYYYYHYYWLFQIFIFFIKYMNLHKKEEFSNVVYFIALKLEYFHQIGDNNNNNNNAQPSKQMVYARPSTCPRKCHT